MGKSSAEHIKKIRIGRAAAKLFNEKGYLETSIKEIASAARMSKGGIFHYFSTKDEILCFILSNYMDLVLEGLEEDLKKIGDSFSRLQFFISRHIELYEKNTAEARTLLHEAHNLPARHFKILAEKEKKYFLVVANLLSDYLGGSIPKDRLTAMAFTLFGMCNWIYQWYNPKGTLPPKELSEMIYSIFSAGVTSYEQSKRDSIEV